MRIELLVCGLMFTLMMGRAGADDGAVSGVGGRWRMLKAEHRQVGMVREYVRIVPARNGRFETTADFVFRNFGPATRVTMGFPESQSGVDKEGADAAAEFRAHPTLLRFASWVDGRRVRVVRHIADGREAVDALWTKTVRFGRNGTRHVRVRYVSYSGGSTSDGTQSVDYNFTGGNWRGEVEESILDIELPRGAYLWNLWKTKKEKAPRISKHGNHFRFRWTHYQAQQEFDLSYLPTFPNELLLHADVASADRRARPSYVERSYEAAGRIYTPDVPGNGLSEAVLLRGRLWIASNALGGRWNTARRGLVLTKGQRRAFFSAVGATRRATLWPLAPHGTFWIDNGSARVLMIPARGIVRQLGGRFGFDFTRGRAIWVVGRERRVFDAVPEAYREQK